MWPCATNSRSPATPIRGRSFHHRSRHYRSRPWLFEWSQARDADLLTHPEPRAGLRALQRRRLLECDLVERCAFPLPLDVRSHLGHRIRVAVKRELGSCFDGEPASGDRGCERGICPRVATAGAGLTADIVDAPHGDDPGRQLHFQICRFGGGMGVEDAARRAQPSVSALKGIDHALMFDSSQGPREEHNIEGTSGRAERRDGAGAHVDMPAKG